MEAPSKSKTTPESDHKSPALTPPDELKALGGMPEKLSVEQIEKVNSPSGRTRAPKAVAI